MKLKLLVLICTFLISSNVFAENDFYVGVKFGEVKHEFQDDSTPLGNINYSVSDRGSGFAIGFKINSVKMEFEHMESTVNINDDNVIYTKVDFVSNALYGVLKTKQDAYLKIKLGFIVAEATRDHFYYGNITEKDSGLSVALGGGFKFNDISIELEYTIIAAEVTYINMGMNYHF